MYTLRRYLEASSNTDLAALLLNGTCSFSASDSFSGKRWNAFAAGIEFFVPVENLPKLTKEMRETLCRTVDSVFPKEAGYDIFGCDLSPLLEMPPEDGVGGINTASLGSKGLIEHDRLWFRSRSETRIYDALKKRNVLFFANATAVLGGKGEKREPDFLVCQDGKWGILEVMGEDYHPSATAMRDHDRARLFKDYRLYYIEFYTATECYNQPDKTVDDFLSRLSKI
jgi:hypothetical protein